MDGSEPMIRWRYPDPDAALAGVRLQQHAGLVRVRGDQLDFGRDGADWVLELPRPPIDRIEYFLELRHHDGRVETVNDPGTPLRAAGVFGEPSVLELPGYVAPWWLGADPGEWTRTELSARGRGLRDVPVQLCSPAGSEPAQPMPLLVVHDGGELDALARLTTYAAATVAAGTVPAYRIALLSPLDRDNWYSGSTAYGRTLATSVLPLLRFEVAVRGPVVGYGASLGALSMLATELRHPGTFGGLMLASGSFFHPTDDAQESGFRRYWRIVDRVTDVLEGAMRTGPAAGAAGIPWLRVGMVCGTVEENLANNRRMSAALSESGHGVSFAEFRDAHNFTAWRDAFDPHLTSVLADLWG
jgi:enterochelin esterase-like enzyme